MAVTRPEPGAVDPLAELGLLLPEVIDLDRLEAGPERSGLRIEVLGPPSVQLAGRPVRFATRHAELAVYLLALAGTSGIPAPSLGRYLWPGAPEARWGPRLRTLLWQVRNALREEAWRVQRRAPAVILDLTGAELDLAELLEADVTSLNLLAADAALVPRDGRRRLARPVLEGWGAAAVLADLGVDLPLSALGPRQALG